MKLSDFIGVGVTVIHNSFTEDTIIFGVDYDRLIIPLRELRLDIGAPIQLQIFLDNVFYEFNSIVVGRTFAEGLVIFISYPLIKHRIFANIRHV